MTFVILIILQEFVFDNINIVGLVNPYVYIMFIIMLPLNIQGWLLLLLGFASGAVMDLVAGTICLQTICATWLAFVRPTMVNIFIGKDEANDGGVPSASRIGAAHFLRYVSVMVLLFNIPLFLLEDFDTAWYILTARIVLSSIFSAIVIYFLHTPLATSRLKL